MDDGVDADKRATLRRFAALGAATPLADLGGGRGGDDADPPDGGDTRAAVRGYVAATPGAHFSKVRDDLRLATGEAQHHLRRLVDAGDVESRRDGDYRRFYPAGRFTAFERTVLGHLRRGTRRGMVLAALRRPGVSGADLAAALDVTPATVSAHAGDLTADGVLARTDGTGEDGGYRACRPATVVTLVVRHADSLGADAAAFAADADGLLRYDP
ncbi:MAG: winged helix-turn-helix transcriptional regulator [Haloferacaceae archaeon]